MKVHRGCGSNHIPRQKSLLVLQLYAIVVVFGHIALCGCDNEHTDVVLTSHL